MKKTKLDLQRHRVSDEACVEIWSNGKLIGMVYAADGAGVRVVSKYPMEVLGPSDPPFGVIEIKIKYE